MQVFLAIAAILGGLSVAGGAFASHALQNQLPARAIEVFGTGIRYQMYHALALLAVAILLSIIKEATPWFMAAGWLFIAGVVLFSGSLYLISLAGIKAVGPITPLGGVAFLAGWACLAIAALRIS
ncbi:DUF423 domain-containing protein [Oscillatoria sp. CS-180]|uniref:DUF423 domain-containing protein n=1 Tax=Oscillatoria sp. CS-180 TaxID=3021720 RepID=UPI00232D2B6C|nr:DUF423 domain-containing protein [Oscillatoria sp. CS-180]MDB9527606.1 DUF423 domain-containing protein [Oscillatoria sp. CS-180]